MADAKVETFYGDFEGEWSPYLSRVEITGSLSIHVIHRGDGDPDPHDHKRAFFTFPFVSYVEHVYEHSFEGSDTCRVVRAWRPHFRGRTFTHRILGRWSGERDRITGAALPTHVPGAIATLVLWVGRKRSEWGFWVYEPNRLRFRRLFVPWKAYIERRGRT